MRAVRATIRASSEYRIAHPKMDEINVAYNAMRGINLSKFVGNDVQMFDNIIKDIFMGSSFIDSSDLKLRECVEDYLKKSHYDNNAQFVDRIMKTWDNALIRSGVMLIGKSGVGKTVVVTALSETLKQFLNENRSIRPEQSIYKPINT